MKIAIIGSRIFNDYYTLQETLKPYKFKITTVVSGAAKGADLLGEKWALENNMKVYSFDLEGNSFSVDIYDDYLRAKTAMSSDPFRKLY